MVPYIQKSPLLSRLWYGDLWLKSIIMGFDSRRLHQMDITRTPIISKAVSPYWCGCSVKTETEGQGFVP